MNKSLLVFLLIMACSLINDAHGQDSSDLMKKTAQKLINYLNKSDTAGIHSLFRSEENFSGTKDLIEKDSKLFKKITTKYRIPSKENWELSKGPYQENIVKIVILNKEDSAFIKKFELLIYFLPDQFLNKAGKIDNYFIVKTPLKKEEKKLLLNPSFN